MSRLYLTNLPSHIPRDDIVKYLERFGTLTEFKQIGGGVSGFAQYKSAQDAKVVLDRFQNQLFLGHRIVIELARPLRKDMPYTEPRPTWRPTRSARSSPSNRPSPCRYSVLVDNIPRHICWQELKDFGRLSGGAVAFCDLDPSRNGRGFIEYFCREDAEEAIELLDGQKLGGGIVRVSKHSWAARRSSRSRSPIHRSVRYAPPQPGDEPSHNRPPASRYSRRSSELPSDRFTSLYSDNPVVDWYTLSQAVESSRNPFTPGVPQASTSTDSTEPFQREPPVAARVMASDYYDFDGYFRLSFDRRLSGIYS